MSKSGSKTSSFQNANVLSLVPEGKRLFRFGVSGEKMTRSGESKTGPGEPLPPKEVARDWQLLLQPRIDIAWLPTDHAYIRAITLPPGDPAEIPGMVEFQLEQLSPLPPAQIVWTADAMPSQPGEPQAAIVTIVGRQNVEEFLGTLEQNRYVADQLDLPLVRELCSLPNLDSGLRLIVEELPGSLNCLAAWFDGGKLKETSLTRITEDDAGARTLVEQLTQSAWAAEADGWLKAAPQIYLHALPQSAAALEPALREWSGQPVKVAPRAELAATAELSVRECVKGRRGSLVPDEIRSRHRQQFVDGLWMKGLAGAGVAYMAIVFIYLGLLNYQKYRLDDLKDEVNGMARKYTNAIQLKAQVQILQEQVALRYAALDSWKTVAETLPESLTLESLDFRNGRTLMLRGTATEDARPEIIRFNSRLHEATSDGSLLFSEVRPAKIGQRGGAGGVLNWDFEAELKRAVTQ